MPHEFVSEAFYKSSISQILNKFFYSQKLKLHPISKLRVYTMQYFLYNKKKFTYFLKYNKFCIKYLIQPYGIPNFQGQC